jgi:hypothetical protein
MADDVLLNKAVNIITHHLDDFFKFSQELLKI